MQCYLCKRESYKKIWGIPYCKKDYLITKDYLLVPIKSGLPRKVFVDEVIKFLEKQKNPKINIYELAEKFNISFNTARDYMLELEQINFVINLENGNWEIVNEN